MKTSTKKQAAAECMEHVSNRLCGLRSVIELCAFAAEARRTLADFDHLKSIDPAFKKAASHWIEADSEWKEHADSVGLVLKDAAHQIGELQNLLDHVEA